VSAPAPAPVRIRPPAVTRVGRVAVGCLILGVNAVMLSRPDFREAVGAGWVVFAVVSVVLIPATLLLELFRPDGVDLLPDAVVIHRLFRSRRVAWRDVADVRVDGYGQGVVLERTDGRRTALAYPRRDPLALNRRRFDEHYTSIRDHWLAYHDPDRRPVR
jgi:hypothetical protein